MCRVAGGQVWISCDTIEDMSTVQNITATAQSLLGTLRYSNEFQKPTLAQLRAYGRGDCSDFTWAIFNAYGYDIGGMSYNQANARTLVAQWSGPRGGAVAAYNSMIGKFREGDIVCMAIDRSRPNTISHVEYLASVPGMAYGHGGPGKGPTYHNIGRYDLLPVANKFVVRRIVQPTDNTHITPSTPTTGTGTDDKIVEDIRLNAKATHVIFKNGGGICIANILAGTYQRMPNMATFELRKTVLSRIADLHYWREFTTAKNSDEADARAFGVEVK